MTWTASGPYLPMTEPVDWNCIPSALGRGSALSVGAGRLHFPLAGSWLVPLGAHPGVHPVLTSWWWIHNFREKMNSGSSEILYIIMQTTKSSCTSTFLSVTEVTQGNAFLLCYSTRLFAEVQPNRRSRLWRIVLEYLTTHVSPEGWHLSALVSIQPTTARINYHSGLWPCLICSALSQQHLEISRHLHVAPSEPQILSPLHVNALWRPSVWIHCHATDPCK